MTMRISLLGIHVRTYSSNWNHFKPNKACAYRRLFCPNKSLSHDASDRSSGCKGRVLWFHRAIHRVRHRTCLRKDASLISYTHYENGTWNVNVFTVPTPGSLFAQFLTRMHTLV